MQPQNLDATTLNSIIEEEIIACVKALKEEMDRLGIKNRSGELRKIKYRMQKKNAYGVYTKVRFIFPRYGIFIHRGARRGHGGQTGSKWDNARGITMYTSEKSMGKMNTGRSKAKEWFYPVIETFQERLKNRMTKHYINAAYAMLKK